MRNHEVSEVSLAILISHTPHAFSFGNAGENEIPQSQDCLIPKSDSPSWMPEAVASRN